MPGRHKERHRTERIGWLRAAVLGANDGIVTTASLHLRAQSYGLFRHDRGIARAALGRGSRTHHQHGFCRAPRRRVGFRGSSNGEELRSHESLWSVEAMQHPVHAPPRLATGRPRPAIVIPEITCAWIRARSARVAKAFSWGSKSFSRDLASAERANEVRPKRSSCQRTAFGSISGGIAMKTGPEMA
jgi:hypothetical protein